jgi:hypothetical protein
MKKNKKLIIALILIVAAAVIYFIFFHKPGVPAASLEAVEYYCPVHEKIVLESPGTCPICHKPLEPRKKAEEITGLAGSVEEENIQQIEEAASDEMGNRSGSEGEGSIGASVIVISTVQEKEAGIRIAPVEKRKIVFDITAPGQIPDGLEQGGPAQVILEAGAADAVFITAGAAVVLTAAGQPSKTFSGKVSNIEKSKLNPAIVRVTALFENIREIEKDAGPFECTIRVDLGERLCVPSEAVFDTDDRQVVYIKSAPGRFEPRLVKVGAVTEKFTEIISGAVLGESVVTSAAFLAEAEAKAVKAVETKQEAEAGAHTGE